MTILHVIHSLDPAGGGPPMIAASLAAGQARTGHTARLASYRSPGGTDATDAAYRDVPGFADVDLIDLGPVGFPERLTASGARRRLREAIRQADVIHLHGVWEPLIRAAALECRRLARPYFVILNGMLDPWSLRQKRLKKRLALALGYRAMLNHAAGLQLGNVDEQRLIGPLRLTAPKLIVPNGVFLEELDPPPDRGRFRARHPEIPDKPLIVFINRLHYKKGLDYLADAFAMLARRLPDPVLVVAGPDQGAREPFLKSVRRAGVADRVFVLGAIYGREKREALADATCFCLPSRQEGFSMAITEALACGVPVVITDACHFPEVAEVGAGEVVALNARQLADALQRVCADAPLRERMARAGRRLVEQRYTWPAVARRMVDAYQSIGPRAAGRAQ